MGGMGLSATPLFRVVEFKRGEKGGRLELARLVLMCPHNPEAAKQPPLPLPCRFPIFPLVYVRAILVSSFLELSHLSLSPAPSPISVFLTKNIEN